MVIAKLPKEVQGWVKLLAAPLHERLAWRLQIVLVGLLFATGRRTVASWLRAARVGKGYKPYYYFLSAVGRRCGLMASRLVRLIAERLADDDGRAVFALDDSPTKRYGPKVEGAGIHHNPTPGPAGQKFLYGHVWVTVSWIVPHPLWGVIGLPLRAALYVRAAEIDLLQRWYPDLAFRTKLQLAEELVQWLAGWLQYTGKKLWLVMDGAYAKRGLLRTAKACGVTVVSRLRQDAALRSLPEPVRPGRRGRRPTYGKRRFSLAKRAGQAGGWETGVFTLYDREETKTYKTFLATYAVAGGLIRVVLVKEERGWLALFCTDSDASVAQILETYAQRAAIEQNFHDLKEVHGVGQVQLRNLWANLGAFNLGLWLHTLVELWAWDQPAGKLRERRRQSPWDTCERRPSHGDRCNAMRRQGVREPIQRLQRLHALPGSIHKLLRGLVQMVT